MLRNFTLFRVILRQGVLRQYSPRAVKGHQQFQVKQADEDDAPPTLSVTRPSSPKQWATVS